MKDKLSDMIIEIQNLCYDELETDKFILLGSKLDNLVKEAQKEVIEEIINEYLKESERSHFGLKLLKLKEDLDK